MSTWISDLIRAFALMAVLPLAGCFGTGDPSPFGFRAPSGASDAPQAEMRFYGGAVVVTGPPGYCVDAKSVRRRAAGSFALLTACVHLSDQETRPVMPAVITVSVLPHDPEARQPTAEELGESLSPIRPLHAIDGTGIALVHLPRGGAEGVPGSDPRYWRASLVINGHLVGLAAYGSQGSAVAGPGGRDILIETGARMRKANPDRSADTAADPTDEAKTTARPDAAPPAAEETSPPRGLRSILTGLFRNPA